MKKIIYAGIVGMIIGGVATCICYNRKKREETSKLEKNNKEIKEQTMVFDEEVNKGITIQEETMHENTKQAIFDTISSRHYETSTIVKDAVDNIKKQISISNNINTEIDEITVELDKMISED